MEPIQRVLGVAGGIDRAQAVHALARVERDEPRPEDQGRRKRRAPRPAAQPQSAPHTGEDGLPHVDVQA